MSVRELGGLLHSGAFERALEVADKLIASGNSDDDIVTVRILCLIQLSEVNEALDALNSSKLKLPFEKAYCLYRLDRLEEARTLVDSHGTQEPKWEHLEAQIAYKLEDFERASDLYEAMLDEEGLDDDSRLEVAANLTASQTAGGLNVTVSEDLTTFDVLYNIGTKAFADGDIGKAIICLREAEAQCRDQLAEEGLTTDEIEDEAVAIRVQLAAALQRNGDVDEASAIYEDILASRPENGITTPVVLNNIVCLRGERDLFDSLKKIERARALGGAKLQTAQMKGIAYNRALLFLYRKAYDKCRGEVAALQESPDTADPALAARILAACFFMEGATAKAESVLTRYLDESPQGEGSDVVRLALVQLLLLQSRNRDATAFLETLPTLHSSPRVVATLVSLYENTNNFDSAARVLGDTVDWWSNHDDKTTAEKARVWRVVGAAALRVRAYGAARKVYSDLVSWADSIEESEKAGVWRALQVLAGALADPAAAAELESSLPPLDGADDVDGAALENVPVRTAQFRRVSLSVAAGKQPVVVRKKKPRKKRIRLPKNYDPNKQPDPERWLPRHQRSNYNKLRHKGGKRKGKTTRGGQGMASEAEAAKLQLKISDSKDTKKSPSKPQGKKKNRRR